MYLKQLQPAAARLVPQSLTTLTLICNLIGENSIRKHLNGGVLAPLQPPQDPIVHHPFYCRVVWVFYWPCRDFVLPSRRAREEERDKEEIAAGSGISQEKSLAEITTMAIERYERDSNYKLLRDRVTDVYVEHLKSDIKILKQKLMQSDIDDDDRCCLGFEITDAAWNCFTANSMNAHIISATLVPYTRSLPLRIIPMLGNWLSFSGRQWWRT
ncbi:hypothetical protein ACFX11_039055 [Malus domestica]